MPINLTDAILAVGALGTAATGLVDTSKVLWGGMSRVGFGYIKKLMARTIPPVSGGGPAAGLGMSDILGTLRANWMNGMETGAQKAIAKSFIKMHFNVATAEALARETNIDPAQLGSVANKLASMSSLQPEEADTFGRFDLAISALVDQAYERADQLYRNSCKALAALFAVVLAITANETLKATKPEEAVAGWLAIVVGLIATPLAPVAKDLANAVQKASDAVRAVRG